LRPSLILALAAATPVVAQNVQVPGLQELRFGAGIQFTGIYTYGARADVNNDGRLEPVDNRFDIGARRARFTLNGRLRDDLDFRVIFYYDNIGRDRFTGTRGTPSEGNVGVWDAFWGWHAHPVWANFTIGYFRPQIGREHITSGFQTNSSMDKLPTQNYLRSHVLGRSNGRETGLNLGGLYLGRNWSFNYNAGFFDTSHEKVTGQAFGAERWSPLLAGRIAFTLGDPEMRIYGIDYQVNYFGRRRGITAALNYSHQGETNVFRKNELTGFDILANYRPLNFDAECEWLKRRRTDGNRFTDRVCHVRAGYNIRVRTTWLEPVAAVMRFTGSPLSVNAGGRDNVTDLGLNWYVRETRIKFNLHYTRQRGRATSGYDDGKIRRGDMVGLGIQLVY